MKTIDGSYGEGGGQILRTSVALSCITGQDIRVVNIRAKRPSPGLKKQHLTALRAASIICSANVEGLKEGSKEIIFRPGSIRSGNFTFDIGTAGSVTLVLQTLLPIMAFSSSQISVEVKGGTDVPWSPPIDYVRFVMLPLLKRVGYEVELNLIRRGHYPKGGGFIRAFVKNPPKGFSSISLVERGQIKEIRGLSHCVKLPKHVAERQATAAEAKLRSAGIRVPISIDIEYYEKTHDPHRGPGSGIVLWSLTDKSILGGDALGAKGKRAEVVGEEAADKLIEDLKTGAALDRHMSDNMLIYLALAKGKSKISGSQLSMHALTVIWLINKLATARIDVVGEPGKVFTAEIVPVRSFL